MKKKILVIVFTVVIVVLIAAKLVANKTIIEENKIVKKDLVTSVTASTVELKEIGTELTTTGVTVANQEVVIKSETAGQVTSINFNLGEYINKGKVLIGIDDKLAELNLKQAELNMNRALDEYQKTKNLFEGKATTETKLRDAKIDYERAKINYEQAEKQFSFTKVKATQNGYIVSKLVDNGAYVTPGTPVVSIVDISKLKVAIKISEKDVYKIKLGQNVKVSSSAVEGYLTTGKVTFVSNKGDNSHNYDVEVLINNSSANQLKAGTFVDVTFSFPSNVIAKLIPRESLVGSIKNAKVYSIINDKAILKSITIGRDLGEYLEVINGVEKGEKIVRTGQINLSDNSPVKVLN
ncbi:MAG TPA: efflux RND transporter periplasmic adaptor subunit [Melioribacteraceae bacterium]|nr:efflux RND transporter periplasmic adaptor subunit [Melioribacteraceae bacterium]